MYSASEGVRPPSTDKGSGPFPREMCIRDRVTHIPVIEISLSVYDILRAMKLAENYSDKYAVVGFPSITSSAHLLCDLLQYKIDIVTIHNENEVESTLRELKKNGCRMILCDMISNTTAKRRCV